MFAALLPATASFAAVSLAIGAMAKLENTLIKIAWQARDKNFNKGITCTQVGLLIFALSNRVVRLRL